MTIDGTLNTYLEPLAQRFRHQYTGFGRFAGVPFDGPLKRRENPYRSVRRNRGLRTGCNSTDSATLFKSVGLAVEDLSVEDMATANLVYRRAMETGAAARVELVLCQS